MPYEPSRINFSVLGDIGQSVGEGINKYRLKQALEGFQPGPNGELDYGDLYNRLNQAGLPEQAVKVLQLQSKSKQQQTAPAGFRFTSDGNLSPIPGGPADPTYLRGKPDRLHMPAGYDWDPNDPSQLRPIPGGPAGKLPPNTAGAIAMMQTGQQELDKPVSDAPNAPTARSLLQDPSKWSYSQQAQSVYPETMSYFGQSDVANAQSAVKTNVEAALRMMTGAAAPEQEVARYAAMFTPTWNDTKARAEAKLRRLDEFTARAQSLATQGRSDLGIPQSNAPSQTDAFLQAAPPVPGAMQMNVGPGADPRGAYFPPQVASAAPAPPANINAQELQLFKWAQEAIAAGADPKAVAERLQQLGIKQ